MKADREICMCGHLREHHKIGNSSCKGCNCNSYTQNFDLSKTIKEVLQLYNPEKIGGCYQATRFLCKYFPFLTEQIISIKNNSGDVKHCVANTNTGLIIDTQWLQFSLILDIDCNSKQYIFTEKEHEELLPRYIYGEGIDFNEIRKQVAQMGRIYKESTFERENDFKRGGK